MVDEMTNFIDDKSIAIIIILLTQKKKKILSTALLPLVSLHIMGGKQPNLYKWLQGKWWCSAVRDLE